MGNPTNSTNHVEGGFRHFVDHVLSYLMILMCIKLCHHIMLWVVKMMWGSSPFVRRNNLIHLSDPSYSKSTFCIETGLKGG